MAKTKKNPLPVSYFQGELVTLLEFARIAVRQFPKTTDKILTEMDLSDEAFGEEIQTLCKAVDFDFSDNGEEKDGSDD